MFPVVMVAGPRQSGKSTLVKQMFAALAPNVRRSTVIYSGTTHLPLAANYADMDYADREVLA